MPAIPSTLPPSSSPAADAPEPAVRAAQEADAAQQRAKVEKAAVQFEGLFIHQMLQEMRRSADEIAGDDALFKGQSGNGLLDFADTMLADAMASQRAFGIADTIVRQMAPPTATAAAASGAALPLKSGGARVAFPLHKDARDGASAFPLDHPGPLP